MTRRSAFTLIELLVVIAIIAILAVVVVLVLNPAQLLAQSRDANRVQDMATLNSAVSLYATDQSGASGFSLGNASSVYVSLPDPTLTGTQTSTCASLGLPALPSGYAYQCTSAAALRSTDGTGWIPVDFKAISSGSPMGSLPVDPVNASSSGLYYTYSPSGSLYMTTAIPESQKQKAALEANPMISGYPGVLAQGSALTISPLWSTQGLVGYWPLNEGTGTTAIDQSGNGNNGTWAGTQAGSNGTYYGPGLRQSFAGYFDGGTDYVNIPSLNNPPVTDFTIVAWADRSASCNGGSYCNVFATNYIRMDTVTNSSQINFASAVGGSLNASGLSNGEYTFLAGEISGSAASFYVNGQLVGSGTMNVTSTVSARIGEDGLSGIGGYDPFPGFIQDVRIYNRALSPAEIMALYNSEK